MQNVADDNFTISFSIENEDGWAMLLSLIRSKPV